MKKSFRIVLALLMTFVLLFSFSSCSSSVDTKFEKIQYEEKMMEDGSKKFFEKGTGKEVVIENEGTKEEKVRYKDFVISEKDKTNENEKEESRGFLGSIYYFLGKVLSFFSSFTHSYIFSLLIFAIIMKLLFVFSDIKQRKTIIKQAYFKPTERAIMNKYKGRNDKPTQMKMQQELMDARQRAGISMTGGCLPMLIQMPVIFILYEVIRNPLRFVSGYSVSTVSAIKNALCYNQVGMLKGNVSAAVQKCIENQTPNMITELDLVPILKNNWSAFQEIGGLNGMTAESLPNFNAFGSYVDLSFTPTFKTSGWNFLYLLIPALTFLIMFFSMKLNRKLSESASEEPQEGMPNMAASMKVMDFVMPAMSCYFTFLFPAVLGVYWMFNNLISMVQQLILKKIYPLPVFTKEDYKKAEREYNKGKEIKKVQKNTDPNRPKVRSLHHIDDDDEEYAVLPPMKEEEDETAVQAKAGKVEVAPLKKDGEDEKKKKKKKKNKEEASEEPIKEADKEEAKEENAPDASKEKESDEENQNAEER